MITHDPVNWDYQPKSSTVRHVYYYLPESQSTFSFVPQNLRSRISPPPPDTYGDYYIAEFRFPALWDATTQIPLTQMHQKFGKGKVKGFNYCRATRYVVTSSDNPTDFNIANVFENFSHSSEVAGRLGKDVLMAEIIINFADHVNQNKMTNRSPEEHPSIPSAQ